MREHAWWCERAGEQSPYLLDSRNIVIGGKGRLKGRVHLQEIEKFAYEFPRIVPQIIIKKYFYLLLGKSLKIPAQMPCVKPLIAYFGDADPPISVYVDPPLTGGSE